MTRTKEVTAVKKCLGIFLVMGILAYSDMLIASLRNPEAPAGTPFLMLFMIALFAFFLYLLFRKPSKSRNISEGQQANLSKLDASKRSGTEKNISPASIAKEQKISSTEELEDEFFIKHAEKLQTLEYQAFPPKIKDYTNVEDYRKAYETAIHYLDELQAFCSQHQGGKEYFDSMYNHCSNSRTRDFNLAKQWREGYKDLIENYDHYAATFERRNAEADYFTKNEARIRQKIISIVQDEPGFVQKNLYSHFEPCEKDIVIKVLQILVKEKVIVRNPFKNTFQLYIASQKAKDK